MADKAKFSDNPLLSKREYCFYDESNAVVSLENNGKEENDYSFGNQWQFYGGEQITAIANPYSKNPVYYFQETKIFAIRKYQKSSYRSS